MASPENPYNCPRRADCGIQCEPEGCDYLDGLLELQEDPVCDRCGGEGSIITCCDDICVGSGHCIHGDGEELCPACEGGF